jgi:hypothetical protein
MVLITEGRDQRLKDKLIWIPQTLIKAITWNYALYILLFQTNKMQRNSNASHDYFVKPRSY